ncbi:hypothetical protein [Nonomuraea sp. NPDC049028]|uniref:hypothetical protein n=1 Tax=Nonomuraea sp. NPDC049028 TaxID=3364348 RepID=UPI0037138672
MTATDPFTTPAEAQHEGLARQARDFFALAMTPEHLSMWARAGSGQLDYENGVQAVRDALVGQGHATLAVNANLDRIATALEMLAAMPSAIQCLGDQMKSGLQEVGGELHELCATVDQGVEIADSTAAATASISVSMHDLTDAVLQLSEPRPRWWQWRIRRALRTAAEPQETAPPPSCGGRASQPNSWRST